MTCIYLTKLWFLILMAIFIFSDLHKIILLSQEDTKIKKKHKSNAAVHIFSLCRFNIQLNGSLIICQLVTH